MLHDIPTLLARHRRAALAAAVAVTAGGALWLGIGYVHYARLAATQAAAARRAETANVDLQNALARLRNKLGTATQALNSTQRHAEAVSVEARRKIAVSQQAASSKAGRVAELTRALDAAQRELHLTEAQRVTLLARLSKAQHDLAAGTARQHETQAGIDRWHKKVEQLAAERDKAAAERDRLRARVGELERQSQLRARHRARAVAEARPAAQPQRVAHATSSVAAPARPAAAAVVAAVARPSHVVRPAPTRARGVAVKPSRLKQFERVLASAGVDVSRLFAQYGMRSGEGGPFVPVPRGGVPTMSAAKFAALSRLVKTLPIDSPLKHYRLGSPFGVRSDPFNHHHEFHTGVDMDAPYMTPVYATAPGVVEYAGYRNDYGKVVEIDHGHGIATRYAHLHRYIVSVGQHVAAHQQIGFLGSTGRATGPHLHYEVLVNGEPQNPEKFFGLAHLVPVSTR